MLFYLLLQQLTDFHLAEEGYRKKHNHSGNYREEVLFQIIQPQGTFFLVVAKYGGVSIIRYFSSGEEIRDVSDPTEGTLEFMAKELVHKLINKHGLDIPR
jgi:hypothetical protein